MKYLPYLIIILIFGIVLSSCVSPGSQKDYNLPPQWSKEAVWYQIYPERFWNGDHGNDPGIDEVRQGWPYLSPKDWEIHPWTSDWYEAVSWETSDTHNYYFFAGARRYGGDLQGVLDRLDYLTDLGITAIYFNPLFESPSHHKYDTGMYHHIDNNFGPRPGSDRELWALENPIDPESWQWTTADSLFLYLINRCHEEGIKVIIDGVFNHVGFTFWAFQDVIERQQDSPYKDWFIIRGWDDPETLDNEFDYAGWNGVTELPEIREDENGLIHGFQQHIFHVVKRWMDPNGDGDPSDGIDGWRLDVAEKVHPSFWKTFRGWVKEINPDAYIVGEIWWEDWPRNKMFNAAPWLEGDMFDGVMNYRLGRAIKKFVIDVEQQINAQAFADSINQIIHDYGFEHFSASQNLISSHDIERLGSQIVNPDRWMDHNGNPAQDIKFNVRKPNRLELQKQKLVAALQIFLPGAPMIYYGDEAGMWGGDDPDCRKPMIWMDLEYMGESAHPFGKKRENDPVLFNPELYSWYRRLIQLRKNNPTLALGDIQFLRMVGEGSSLFFSRTYRDQKLLILVNNQSKKIHRNIHLPDFSYQKVRDLVTDLPYSILDQKLSIDLAPFAIVILSEEQQPD
jgi:glycosidase